MAYIVNKYSSKDHAIIDEGIALVKGYTSAYVKGIRVN